jgi:hypothetical protein
MVMFNSQISLAQPASQEDIQALTQGTFYSFATTQSKLKKLSFEGCGINHDNDWKEHPERLEGLLKAMAKTPIKDSLEKIWTRWCGVSEEQVKKMVEDYGFTKIKEINSYSS